MKNITTTIIITNTTNISAIVLTFIIIQTLLDLLVINLFSQP